jgi:hypothetical protein
LLPETLEPEARKKAGLAILTCLGLTASIWAVLGVWLVMGNPATYAAWAGMALTLFLLGIVALVRVGHVTVANWLIVGLLTLTITLVVVFCDGEWVNWARHLLPAVLAFHCLMAGAGLGVTLLAAAWAFLTVSAPSADQGTLGMADGSTNLSLGMAASGLVLLFLALVIGLWARYVNRVEAGKPGQRSVWEWILPDDLAVGVRGHAGILVASCLGLIGSAGAYLLTMLALGHWYLQMAGWVVGLILLLAGIGALARRGKATLANWLLLILLLLAISLVIVADGSEWWLCSATFFVPVALAVCGIGARAGLGVAVYGSAVGCITALADLSEPLSHLLC